MARWFGHEQGETKVLSEGDARFIGIDMTRDRALLQPGILASSGNKRLINGIAATRPGCVWEPDFNPGYTNPLVGSGVFSNPNGDEMLLVAEQGATFVWALQYGKDPVQIPIDKGTLTSSWESGQLDCDQAKFVQSFDHIYLLRRPNNQHSTLIWDGTLPPSSTAVFTPVTQQLGPPLASVMIPGGIDPAHTNKLFNGVFCPWNGEPFAERVLFYNDLDPDKDDSGFLPDRDTFVMTDPDRWDSYNQPQNSFRINSGESNIITRVLGYYRGSVLCFFKRGIHIMENFTNPASGVVGDQRMINNFLGCVSNQGMCQVGVDVYFLSEPGRGVYRISEAVQEQIAVNPIAVSDPIQSFIDSINWKNAVWADMKTLGPYVYLAVPTTTVAANNTVAVYNQYTRQWESIDTFNDPSFTFNQMHVILFGDERKLIAVDWIRSQVYGMYYGQFDDQIGVDGLEYAITDMIETRGYILKDPSAFKRFERVNIGIQTFEPEFTVESISDGYNEVKSLTSDPITKNNLRYYKHGHKFFNPDTDDPDAPKRQDYSDNPPLNFGVEDFEDLPAGLHQIFTWPGTSFGVFNQKAQQTLERYQIRQNGRWSSIRVTNNNGICNLLAISVDGYPTQEGIRTLA